jgi:hypothetical protein
MTTHSYDFVRAFNKKSGARGKGGGVKLVLRSQIIIYFYLVYVCLYHIYNRYIPITYIVWLYKTLYQVEPVV